MVIDNQAKRSFASADVNTVIVLFSSPDESGRWGLGQIARFVMFRAPFEHILSPVIFEEIEIAKKRESTPEYQVHPIIQKELFKNGSEQPVAGSADGDIQKKPVQSAGPGTLIKVAKYIGNKWGGRYLRAPDIYWTLLKKGKGRLLRLDEIVEVRYGIKTGANEFFYVNEGQIQEWRIEKRFLTPVVKSPKECKHFLIVPNELKFKLLMCHKDKKDLKGTSALEYIRWGESRGFHKRPSCTGRTRWWWSPLEVRNSVFVKESNDTSAVFYNAGGYPVDCRLYCADLDAFQLTYLNSAVGAMLFEIYNRAGLGEGARSLMVSDYMQVPILTDTKVAIKLVESALEQIYHLPARKLTAPKIGGWETLDNIIFESFGLTQGEQDAVYEAVVKLAGARLGKAVSLKPHNRL